MKQLTQLTPAEVLLITKNEDVTLEELLKVTFIDLLLKQVLQVIEIEKKITNRDGVWMFIYIKQGSNFHKYNALKHEDIFIKPFIDNRNSEVLFRNFVKITYQSAKNKMLYKSSIYKSLNIKNYFDRNIFQRIFGKATITSLGIRVKIEVKKEIENLEKELPELTVNNPSKAYSIVNSILGCVVLIKTFDMSMLKEVDKDLLEEFHRNYPHITSIGCGSSFDEYEFENTSNDSENSWSGFGGCSDHGCNSGCSGCGGCGGCGGD
ncbi:hypothetical protein [Flavobacterium litorale]|uniref:Uncharacterized protein n=1 Tax=Flavobacterium litorale TaxID=2856519 RepID=A0ABX8V5A3_9FLAO|nr:hypothetical protein [Flavobacterium litorale]QYJ67985.1 hypothetical protein K1I41_10665 [Flavobacterium litorale]